MREPTGRLPGARVWLMAALCPALASCTIRIDCQTALQGIPAAQSIQAPDVAIAVVTKEGRVFPKRLIVRGDEHAIVWVADGQALTIQFKGEAPTTPRCDGPVCTALPPKKPPTDKPVVYIYEGTVTPKDGGKPVPLDPGLEVVR